MREITLVLTLSEEASREYADVATDLVICDFVHLTQGASLDVVSDNEVERG